MSGSVSDNLILVTSSKKIRKSYSDLLKDKAQEQAKKYQGWEFTHSLILLKSDDWLWAIRSDRSRQMNNSERIAQVAQRKWALVSDSLRSLRGNEGCKRIANFAHDKWANEQFAQNILAKKI